MMNRAATTAAAAASVTTASIQNPGRVSVAVCSHAESLAVILRERIANAISALRGFDSCLADRSRGPRAARFRTGEHRKGQLALLAPAKIPRGYLAGVAALAPRSARSPSHLSRLGRSRALQRADLVAAAARSRQWLLRRVGRDLRRGIP